MQAQGYTPEKLAEMKQKKGLTRAYVGSALCYLVMAYVVALFAAYTNSTTLAQGLWLGLLAWLGFAAPIGLTANLFSEKPLAAWVIHAGYQLAYLLIMAVLLSAWPSGPASPSPPPPPPRPPRRPSSPRRLSSHP